MMNARLKTDAATSSLHKVANFYAQKGMPVFPCVVGDKRPATSNGFKSATTDERLIDQWWGEDQANNIGIATGNGLVVIDIDVKNGIDGEQSLKVLESQIGVLPETLTAKTPSGGKHLFYGYPSNYDIRSSANQLGAGVDIRGNGGYVVAAPSKTSVGEYHWMLKREIASLPHAWVSRLTAKHKQPVGKQPTYSNGDSDLPSTDLLRDALGALSAHGHDDWVKVGMGLYKLGDEGFALWDQWSKSADNYDYSALTKRWVSFADTGVQPSTILFMAQQAGWVHPQKRLKTPSPARPKPHVIPVEPTASPVHEVMSKIIDDTPEPLPDELPPVLAFKPEWLPDVVSEFVHDAATRMSAPPDYIAVAVLVSMATVLGRKVAIRPQQHSDWTETCNLWGMVIGRPGVMKSPSLSVGLRAINSLVAKANRSFEEEYKVYEAESMIDQMRFDAIKKDAATKLKKDPKAAINPDDLIAPEENPPIAKRYMTSDALPEALLEVLKHNSNGVLVYRDEMVGLLKGMGREDRAEQRALFLTGWNGNDSYTSDRIGRGLNNHVEAVCLSVLGGTQPSKIASYVRQAVKGGEGDDGLLQRFAVTVWPDTPAFSEVDEPVNFELNNKVVKLFQYLDELTPDEVGAQLDLNADNEPDGLPYLRFTDEARAMFSDWRNKLEERLRSDELHPAFESHLAKFRKLVPSLALIMHLASRERGAVGATAIMQALRLAEYFESHAARLYASVQTPEVSAAKLILKKIKNSNLAETFQARDVYRKGWTGLDKEGTTAALEMLLEYEWLIQESISGSAGRPTTVYTLSPLAEIP